MNQYMSLYAYLAAMYDPFARRVSSAARREAIRQFSEAVARSKQGVSGVAPNASGVASGRHVLVAGCGTGLSLPPIRAMPSVEWVEAVDASPDMLRRAKRKGNASEDPEAAPVAYRQEDIRRLSYPDDAFDAAVSLYVLDILSGSDRHQAVRSIARILRPGGVLITVTVAPPERLAEYPWAVASSIMPALLGGSRPTDLQPVLEAAGFSVEASTRRTQYALASHVLRSRLRV